MEHNDHRSLLRGRLLEHFSANRPALGFERNGGSAERWFGGRRIVSAEKHRRRDKRRCRQTNQYVRALHPLTYAHAKPTVASAARAEIIYAHFSAATDKLKPVQPDQSDDSPKGADELDEEEEESLPPPKIEPPYKFKLSSNQKRRSKLDQHQEPAPAPAPETQPATPPAPAPADPPKRVRLKRSGQMHDELREPEPEPPRPADQY
jgi:hypothetical protein